MSGFRQILSGKGSYVTLCELTLTAAFSQSGTSSEEVISEFSHPILVDWYYAHQLFTIFRAAVAIASDYTPLLPLPGATTEQT